MCGFIRPGSAVGNNECSLNDGTEYNTEQLDLYLLKKKCCQNWVAQWSLAKTCFLGFKRLESFVPF